MKPIRALLVAFLRHSVFCADRMRGLAALVLAVIAGAFSGTALASYHIESLYSDQFGDFQYIGLREDSADGMITPIAGSIITVRHGEVVKQYVIPTNPPADFPAGGLLLISSVADWSSDDFGPEPPAPPDYVMPEMFLPTDGGTIDLDGQDPWTFVSLPTDGSTELLRSGGAALASGQSFALGWFRVHVEFTDVIEYYAPALDHYFMSGSEPDIDAIGSGRIAGWVETGRELAGLTVPIPQYCCSTYGQVAVPVCRFYIPPPAGPSHFFSAFSEECDAIASTFPSLVLETRTAFYVYLPNGATGECPYPFRPVYRVWNQRVDTNHRYISDDLDLRQQMLVRGWIAEGRGPLGVAWCA